MALKSRAILLTWTTNFVNNNAVACGFTAAGARLIEGPAMASAKRVAMQRAATRNAQSVRRNRRPVIDLGVLDDRLGYFVRRLQVWIFQDFIRRLARIDISPAQFSVLVVIGANSGLSQADLAATLGIERARLVRMLHRLERRGLTQRLPSSADGRRHALRLTREGQKVLARAKSLAARHEAVLKLKLGTARHRVLLAALQGILIRSGESFLDGRRDAEQATVMAVTRNQHQADRQAAVARQRQRDGGEIEEVGDGGVAQQAARCAP